MLGIDGKDHSANAYLAHCTENGDVLRRVGVVAKCRRLEADPASRTNATRVTRSHVNEPNGPVCLGNRHETGARIYLDDDARLPAGESE
jgi:hypothetical protein